MNQNSCLLITYIFYDNSNVSFTGHQDGNQTAFSQEVHGCANYFSNSDYIKWEQEVLLRVIPTFFFISIFFLGLLMVHIWKTQRSKLFGWLMLSAVTMLFVFYVFNSIIKLIVHQEITSVCEISGLIIQYSYMSSVLWLSCMSFLMWKTFRKMTPANVSGPKYSWGCQHPSFKWYAIFSWGLPLIMTFVTLILQHSELGESYVSPNIGDDHCFLGSGLPTLLYFHIINAPALVIFRVTAATSSLLNSGSIKVNQKRALSSLKFGNLELKYLFGLEPGN